MNKKYIVGLVALVACVATSFASRKDEVTLVLVPRDEVSMRIGKDISTFYPTLLISYQLGANGAVSLHGWTGSEWVNVSPEKFREGTFFRAGPDSALIVEAAGAPVPETLVPPDAWCGAVYKVATTDPRAMIHLIGQYFDFKYKVWSTFSKNYGLSMDAINPGGLNVAWYHKPLRENLKNRSSAGFDDLQHWVAIRHPAPVLEEEPAAEEPPATEEPVAQPEMETPEDPVVNPFEDAAPEAVVLGPGEAEAQPAKVQGK
ncbi:hypothetical protein [Pontiella sp.]|uniref:hypothetical protein n=1 Tax=Pontiella sp. TaxID=2837462 RepID=UPI003567A9A6